MSTRYRGGLPLPRHADARPTNAPPDSRNGGSFTDRVMARVAEEPTPSPGRVFVRSLRRLALRDALAALAAAWRLATEPAAPVTASARASAAAFFLSVVVLVGVGGAFATSGVLGVLGPDDPAPIVAPAASPAISAEPTPPPPSPTPSPTPTPVVTPPPAEPAQTESRDRVKRATPAPTKRDKDQKSKRETPEPKEREDKDERDGEREREDD